MILSRYEFLFYLQEWYPRKDKRNRLFINSMKIYFFLYDVFFDGTICYLSLQAVREEVSHMKNNLDIMSDNYDGGDDHDKCVDNSDW